MELFATFLDVVLHLDRHLVAMVQQYGVWIYAILFAIIFAETGFVVTPFLPGDSLLFVAGAVAASGAMDVNLLVVLLIVAAVAGNTVNYAVGRWLGKRFFNDRGSRWLNPRHLEKAHAFYEEHGGKAVIISRFLPIVRTYIPFVAGLGAMQPGRYTAFNVAGGALWVASLCYAGFFFGNIPWIKGNLTLIIVGIIAVSLVPVAWAWFKSRKAP
ncbi:MAG TPA: DedA family protein [Usitatibacter sp.]|nr:DedA family protein [Usitatibacter sp.]